MKALLVISFGTTFNDTREKTIDAIEQDLKEAFPDRKFYRAWTSSFIRKRLLSRDGVEIDGPGEAFERMKADGVTDVLIQPTHIMPGEEFGKIISANHRSPNNAPNNTIEIIVLRPNARHSSEFFMIVFVITL